MNQRRFATPRRLGRMLCLGLAGLYAAGMGVFLLLRLFVGDGPWWLALLNSGAVYTFVPLAVFLPMVIWLRSRGLSVILGLLALIGGLWFGPYFLPHGGNLSVAVGASGLRVVSFNVWGHNSQIPEVETWLRAQNADIVLMQEIPERYAAEHVPALADLYPYQIAQPAYVRLYGNLVLSRFPIVQAENFDLEGDGLPSQQRVVVEIPGRGLVAVYNVHLLMPVRTQSRLTMPVRFFPLAVASHYDDSERNAQIARLLERLAAEPLPVILGGDFNLSDQSVTYGQLSARLTDTFRAAGQGFGFSWPTPERVMLPGWTPPLLRIDYVWTSPAFVPVAAQVGPDLGSDHHPVIIDLKVS